MAYHVERRNRLIKEHPEIKELFGISPTLRYSSSALCFAMLGLAVAAQPLWYSMPWLWFVLAYVVGGTMASSLTLAMHELSHRHAFKADFPNRLLGYLADIAVLIPMSSSFRRYHMDHHAYMGTDKDVDLPSQMEQNMFQGAAGKLLWLALQPFFYAIRPMLVRPLPLTRYEVLSIIAAVGGVYGMFTLTGGWTAILFIWVSDVMGLSLHPMAAHFIAEHYVFPPNAAEAETHSYYGPWNMFAWNVGYHTEHHDFPQVAHHNLPKLYEICYKDDPSVSVLPSWIGAQWQFVMDKRCSLDFRVRYDQGHEKDHGIGANGVSEDVGKGKVE